MGDEERKAAALQGTPAAKHVAGCNNRPTDEERRRLDALEDDDVRESLKELHAAKARDG